MAYADSHAHIYAAKFREDLPEIIEQCTEAGVEKIYMPNIDHESIEAMLEVENKYPATCPAMMGLHPCSVNKDFQKDLYEVEEWLSKRKFAAVGEIGTDLYWDKTLFEQQKEAFTIQCDLALDHDLPVVIHCRESIDETIELLETDRYRDLTGVFHCFTGNKGQAKRILDLGFYLGIGGVLTFKNAGLDQVVKDLPLEKMLLETDSPYLAPTPYRGKRNAPLYIPLIAQKLGDIKEVAVAEVEKITTQNTYNLFKAYEL